MTAPQPKNAALPSPRLIRSRPHTTKHERMPNTLYNVGLWREHAAKARALSQALSDPRAKRQMSEIAAGFDLIADLAVKLQTASASTASPRRLTRPVLAA